MEIPKYQVFGRHRGYRKYLFTWHGSAHQGIVLARREAAIFERPFDEYEACLVL